MINTRRLGSWFRSCAAVAAMMLSAFLAEPAMAQERPTASPVLDLNEATKGVDVAASAEAQGAQASTDPVMNFFSQTEISGFVDVYYGYNFNTPASGLAQLRNFDVNHNAFSLNMAELAVAKVPTADSRGGFRLDFDYGHAAAMVNAFEPGSGAAELEHVEQAYLSYLAPGKGVQFDFGKFVTQHGAEVIETKDNWNYSRSLLFTLAIPYYHMGARVTIPVNDKFTFMANVSNGWNNVFENNTGKTVGLMATIKPTPSVTLVQNYMGGPEQTSNNDDWRHLSDTTFMVTATPKVSLMANYDYGRDTVGGSSVTWQGVGGYLKVQANDVFALVPRFEWLDDKDGFMTGASQKVKEVTLTAEVKSASGVIMRLEYRRDMSDTEYFLKNETELIKSQDTFTIGFLYAFSSKAP